jgi:hypothetical protein
MNIREKTHIETVRNFISKIDDTRTHKDETRRMVVEEID